MGPNANAACMTAQPPQHPPGAPPPRPANRRHLICFGIAVAVILVGVVFRIATAPRLPRFFLDSATVSSFSLSPAAYGASLLSADFNVTLAACNPNKKLDIRYDKVVAGVYYGGASIATAWLPPVDQGARTVQTVTAQLVVDAVYVGSGVAGGIRVGAGARKRRVRFQVRLTCSAAFNVNRLNTRRRTVKVYCDDVLVWFDDTAAGAGRLVGPRRSCRVN